MMSLGKLCVCDRCGKSVFEQGVIGADEKIIVDDKQTKDWVKVRGKDLCPVCSTVLDGMFDDFVNKCF